MILEFPAEVIRIWLSWEMTVGGLFSNTRGSCSLSMFDFDGKEYDCEKELCHLKKDITYRITKWSVPPLANFSVIWLKWYGLLPFFER